MTSQGISTLLRTANSFRGTLIVTVTGAAIHNDMLKSAVNLEEEGKKRVPSASYSLTVPKFWTTRYRLGKLPGVKVFVMVSLKVFETFKTAILS